LPCTDNSILADYNAYFRPRVYVIDKAGITRYVEPLGADISKVQNTVKALVEGRPLA
jgi:hypothetical protein